MKHTIKCKVCLEEKPRSEMRKSASGRITRHCKECAGIYRCLHCKTAKPAPEFKTYSHPNEKHLRFEDGEPMRISVCYGCDYKLNKHRYDRYDKKIGKTNTLKAIVMQNMSHWRTKTIRLGLKFDLTPSYLVELWSKQQGQCFYTGQPIQTLRGRSQWDSASLDRKNPKHGYITGNVVWTTRLVNTSKGMRTVEEFIQFCCCVAAFQPPVGSPSQQLLLRGTKDSEHTSTSK